MRYARDLAVVRGSQQGCPVVLGSATPALESWQNARDGRYGLLRMPHRATPRPVPQFEVCDMRGRPTGEPLAPETVDAIRDALDAGGKAIVLYNRRGYAPVVECGDCGAHYSCPSCGVGMVYHQRRQTVTCHYCGYHVRFQPECGSCGGTPRRSRPRDGAHRGSLAGGVSGCGHWKNGRRHDPGPRRPRENPGGVPDRRDPPAGRHAGRRQRA